jgi:hypothetical protein
LQNAVPFPLHVALPAFSFDHYASPPSDTVSDVAIKSIELLCHAANLNALDVFIGGHSSGAIAVSEEALNHPERYKGAFITGASLHRKYNYSFPVPILSVNGELDGFHRVRYRYAFIWKTRAINIEPHIVNSRVGEAYYNFFDRKAKNDAKYFGTALVKNPVVILEGVSHSQFADGLDPPKSIRERDLVPEISIEDAHSRIAEVVAAFMTVTRDVADVGDYARNMGVLQNHMESTAAFLKPM